VHAACALLVPCVASGCVEEPPPAVERGTLMSAQPADQAGENTGAGAVAGVVVGTVAGAAIGGRGAGQVAGALVGGALGGSAGAAAEGAGQTHTGIAYTIRLDDGRVVTIFEHHDPGNPVFAPGMAVAVQTSGRTQIVVPAAPR